MPHKGVEFYELKLSNRNWSLLSRNYILNFLILNKILDNTVDNSEYMIHMIYECWWLYDGDYFQMLMAESLCNIIYVGDFFVMLVIFWMY